jgi:transposase
MKFPLEQILNLPGMRVLSCQPIDGLGIILEIAAEVKYCTCPSCGQTTHSIHQNHWRMIQDLPWSTKTVFLKINRRQFKCNHCQKVFSESLDFVEKNRGYTQRLARNIVQQVLDSNIRSVAERNDLSDEEVESMLEGQADQLLQIDLSQLSRLGIDEIALVKGQGNYLAVLVDLDTHKPIELVKSRRKAEVRKVIEQWDVQVLERLKEVSIDLWSPSKKLVEELMPNADITADRFHVMKQINKELDTARKIEKTAAMSLENQTERTRVLAGIAKSKYSLLKNELDLNDRQKEKLKSVLEVSPTLSKMHALKERFRDIFETNQSWGDSVMKLLDWMSEALSCFPESIKTIVRWKARSSWLL